MSPLRVAPTPPVHDCAPPSDPVPPLRSTWDCPAMVEHPGRPARRCGRVWVVGWSDATNGGWVPGWRRAWLVALWRHKRWLRGG